ncbi:hypothetical protein D3C87_1846250 [compost metagenome]
MPFGMIMFLAEETILGTFGKPRIRTLNFESLEDTGVDSLIHQHFALLIRKNGNRNTPCALT